MKRTLLTFMVLLFLAMPALTPKAFNPQLFSGTILEATYQPTVIKSVQANTITLNSVLTNTRTITSVVPTASVVMYNGQDVSASGSGEASVNISSVVLTNATTVTGAVGVVEGADHIVAFTVLEFLPQFIKNIQSGVGSQTITAVVIAKSAVFHRGCTTTAASSGAFRGGMGYTTLASSTSVVVTGTCTNTAWTIVEFK